MQNIPSSSGDSSVRGLIRKYSSDSSEASPPSSKPPEKKKYGINDIMSNLSTGGSATATGTPVVASSTGAVNPNSSTTATDLSNNVMLQEIRALTALITGVSDKLDQTKNELSARIDNIEVTLSNKIASECEKIRSDLTQEIAAVDAKVRSLSDSFETLDRNLKASNDRLQRVEEALAAADALTPDYYPETTIIATKLAFNDSEDIKKKSQDLINALTAACDPALPQINVVNAMRTPFRDGKPGVVKIQLPSRQNKIDILKNKKKLMDNSNYSRVFIRGSQSHTDRLIQINTNTLLNELGLNDKYRVAANGRLVLNNNAQQHGYGQPPDQRPPWNGPPPGPRGPPGHPGQFNFQRWPPPGQWHQPNGQRPPAPPQNGRY